jgi:hypothetical protein
LTPEELAAVSDVRTGIATTCRFLPSVGDVATFLREREEVARRYRPAPTTYQRLTPDPPVDMPPPEKRREIVERLLGRR